MSKSVLGIAAALLIASAGIAVAQAPAAVLPFSPPVVTDAVLTPMPGGGLPVIQVAEGCGPGRWRGPWGGCRGPGPGYWYAPPPPPAYVGGNGCPPGFWRGPWGHCRDTPYHGALPGGGWK